MRILVVDDSEPVRARLCAMLGDVSPSVVLDEANDGRAALLLLDRRLYDVVVLDLHLPGISGLDVLVELRRTRSAPRTQVVVLTNGATAHHHRACLAAGADFFFDKSSEFDRVCHVVEELVRTLDRTDATVSSRSELVRAGGEGSDGPT